MYLALVPKMVTRSFFRHTPQDTHPDETDCRHKDERRAGSSPLASQFHIIQPQVVK